ncbi:MAG: ABC transporter permease [Ignavibacteria bacterium]|jgi:putative ABC transport system permease protein
MLRNYIKIAVRNLYRHKAYSYINIFGLAIGIACCLLILLYIQDELNYDRFNEKADRIFRINTDLKLGATERYIPLTSDMMGPVLKDEYPQVEEYTRIYCYGETKHVKKGNEFNNEPNIAYVDSTFFKVFTLPVVSGNTDKILNEPNTVVITASTAKKYFGDIDAVGKFIETNDNGNTIYRVAAVIKDMPQNSHFMFDFLFPMFNLRYDYDWGNYVAFNFHTYLLLREGVDYRDFEKNFTEYNDKHVFPYVRQHINVKSKEEFENAGNKIKNSLIPLTDIHLYSDRTQEISPAGNIQYVYIFSAVAMFILIIACINFMNLTTARSANRAREVGIRKVLGTERKNIIFQFLIESTLMAFIAVILAVVIVYHVLPLFSNLIVQELTISDLFSSSILLFIILLPFLVGLAAGSYPAFFLSRFMPAAVIKGKLSGGSKSGGLRNVLVVFQFATSIILVTGTIIIYNQLNYMQNKKLGYKKDQVLIINNAYSLGSNIDVFKEEMLKVPGVINGTISGFLPVPSQRHSSVFFKGAASFTESGINMQRWDVDYDYIKTIGIEMLEGREFSYEFGSDSSAIILNEAAMKQMGYENPIGQKIYTFVKDDRVISYNIIGIVKDFHFESMHQEIAPLGIVLRKSTELCSFKVLPAYTSGIIKAAESKWKSLGTGMPFNFRFLDESFNDIYRAERRVGIIALSFSVLAVFVACLGLFGLAAFIAEQRTKEIGVRKILGASVPSILSMLSKEFIKWIIVANIIAWPLTYFFMSKWLEDFAYRTDISMWVFIISGVTTILIALLTVSIQTIKAALANPVESLRYE